MQTWNDRDITEGEKAYRNKSSQLREVIRHLSRTYLSKMSSGQRMLLWSVERYEQMCFWQANYCSLFGDSHLTTHQERNYHGNRQLPT